jgi:hypothetical protein
VSMISRCDREPGDQAYLRFGGTMITAALSLLRDRQWKLVTDLQPGHTAAAIWDSAPAPDGARAARPAIITPQVLK